MRADTSADRLPEAVVDAFDVGIAVLDDQRLKPLGMRRSDAEAHWCPIAHQTEAVALDPQIYDEPVDNLQ